MLIPQWLTSAFQIVWPGHSFDWGWTDWLGLLAIMVGAALLCAVLAAIHAGEPLKVLRQLVGLVATIFRRKSS